MTTRGPTSQEITEYFKDFFEKEEFLNKIRHTEELVKILEDLGHYILSKSKSIVDVSKDKNLNIVIKTAINSYIG
jgi:hypothetical protein